MLRVEGLEGSDNTWALARRPKAPSILVLLTQRNRGNKAD